MSRRLKIYWFTVNYMKKTSQRLITRNRLIKDLKKLGLKKGNHVAVVLSFKSIGFIKGGPDAFIDALFKSSEIDTHS